MQDKFEPEQTLDELIIAAAQKPKEKAYWLEKLSGRLEKTAFPYDHKAALSVKERKFCRKILRIDGELFLKLMKLSNGSDIRLHIILTAVWLALLKKYTQNNDIVVGTPVLKQKAGGKLINTLLVLRNQLEDSITFKELLLQVRQTVLEATQHQNYPFEILLKELKLTLSDDESPLFDLLVLVKNIHDQSYIRCVKPNMVFSFLRAADYGEGGLEYDSFLYESATIERLLSHFISFLGEALYNVDLKLSEINILSAREKQQILLQFNNTGKDIARDKCYPDSFEEQVSRSPTRAAAVHNEEQISYDVLNEEANRIAYFLKMHGVTRDEIVGIYMKRSIKMLASIIGIFKAGGAYLAIDVDYPDERVGNIVEDSEINILITETGQMELAESLNEGLPGLATILYLEDNRRIGSEPILSEYPVENPGAIISSPSSAGRLAYVIYTSGTTGKPKGVMVHQLGMMNHIHGNINFLSLGGNDIIAQTASPSFDISVWQFLAALIVGGLTFIIDKSVVLDPLHLLDVLRKGKITLLEVVPSLIAAFLEMIDQYGYNELKALRWMVPTGESLSVSLAREWYRLYPRIKLVNAYGPAEASDDVTLWVVEPAELENQSTIPIGKPLQNLHVYIMDANLLLCPVKVPGEICIAGLGVGKGYLKDPEKTAKSFVPNPYVGEIGGDDYGVLYKTGDLGYFREDGSLEFLGRKDYQVKVRGFRIELEEIEHQLLSMDGVKEAVVVVRENENGDRDLCGYVVPNPFSSLSVSGMQENLSANLPYYMVPSYFVILDKLPRTPNGKIDRKVLPAFEVKVEDGSAYIAPRNEIEEKLAGIWSAVLGIEKDIISMAANFFEIGGHSLKATILAAKIHKEFDMVIPLSEIFKNPTIEGIASLIRVINWAEKTNVDTNQGMEEIIL